MSEPVGHPTDYTPRTAPDLLAWIPYTLGYTPAERLVMVAQRAGALTSVVAVDLTVPDPSSWLGPLVRHAVDAKADAVMLALYTERFREVHMPMMCDLHRDLCGEGHIPLAGAWLVTPGTWEDFFRGNDHRIHPITELETTPAACEMILRGFTTDWRTHA